MTRRELLQAAASAGLLAACGAPEPARQAESAPPPTFSLPLGAQLYTVREEIGGDPKAVLEAIAKIGYTEVEVLQATYAQMRPLIEAAGLKAVSMHVLPPYVTGDWAAYKMEKPAGGDEASLLAAAADEAKAAGVSYLVMPYVAPDSRGKNLDFYRDFAAKLTRAGEIAKKAGLGFCYHHHAFEFEPMGDSSPMDVILTESDPALTQLEVDVFWVAVSGNDPVKMLEKVSGRVPLIHLKDKAADVGPQFNEKVAPEGFREVGSGSLDFAAILKAARAAGVKHMFVEQDRTPGSAVDSLKISYDYLRQLRVA